MRLRQIPIVAVLLWVLAPQTPSLAQQDTAPAPEAQPPAAQAQAAQATGVPASSVLRAESKVVRVDVVVTDKKGNYVHGLTQQDFHVFDNEKEQPILNFSYGAATTVTGAPEKRYLVLFFDDSTMELADQLRAREAAQKFIDANVGPDRVMAVVDFTGSLRIIQNFTADAVRLKEAAKNMKPSAVSPNGDPALTDVSVSSSFGGPALPDSVSDFGIHTLLLGIRGLAKDLANVPGRKSVVLFTDGFPLTPEAQGELTATISACNQANVAIYPLDVRGLIAVAPGPLSPATRLWRDDGSNANPRANSRNGDRDSAAAQPRLVLAAYPAEPPAPPQHGGGGGARL